MPVYQSVQRICVILVTLITVSGCASPTVFLNDYKLNPSSVIEIQHELEKAGLEVTVISIPHPATMDASTIILGSAATLGREVDSVVSLLNGLGYESIGTSIIQRGNHWYRGGNMGLYLVDDRLVNGAVHSVIGTYQADNCELMQTLTLTNDYRFTLTYTDGETLQGQWAIDGMPYINLSKQSPYVNFYYQIESEVTHDFSGRVDITKLRPLESQNYRQIENCGFVQGLRVNPAQSL
ncbi:hypothetical protein [Aliidiomarina soli]|uniref:Uncharacterized protein n=1 Tax=Aliidiomarina soli TaxID=1928574 RepID=A0A432WF15_9GAMM|nr:hypothetical protein [Aliidiomarina soli]RUO32355.1 hypothetical protein CWE14_09395 [Aliidiomarina soli]